MSFYVTRTYHLIIATKLYRFTHSVRDAQIKIIWGYKNKRQSPSHQRAGSQPMRWQTGNIREVSAVVVRSTGCCRRNLTGGKAAWPKGASPTAGRNPPAVGGALRGIPASGEHVQAAAEKQARGRSVKAHMPHREHSPPALHSAQREALGAWGGVEKASKAAEVRG